MGSKVIIRNGFLNAITYHYCYNVTTDIIKTLSLKYRRMLASQAKTKAWCEKSSMDEKLHFFNAIGLDTAVVVLPDKVKSGISLKEILKKYEEEKLAAAQREQAKLGCYVVTDRDTSFFLGQMGMTINSESYIRTLDFGKSALSIKNWGKNLDTPIQTEILETMADARLVTNTILNSGLMFDVVTQLFGINHVDLKILMFMFQRRSSYIFREDICDFLIGYISRTKSRRAIKKLILNGYLDKHQEWQKYKYRISTKGINVVNDFINRILKLNQF